LSEHPITDSGRNYIVDVGWMEYIWLLLFPLALLRAFLLVEPLNADPLTIIVRERERIHATRVDAIRQHALQMKIENIRRMQV
jgi:hypothetical protein